MNYLKTQLPKGWALSSLGETCLVMSGQTPKGINNLLQTNGHIPWFRVGNMNEPGNEEILTLSELMLTLDKISSLGLHVRPKNTIVFPKRGGAIATNKKRILGQPSAYDLNLMGIFPIEFNVRYFWHWFQSIDLKQLSDGSNVPQINHGDIEPLKIPLPPLNEQKRIVVKIEALQTRSQRVKEELEGIKPLLDQFRQSVLAAAFRGDLTKDWREQNPDIEPAEVLLERIRVERRRRWEEAELEKMKASGKVPKDDSWKKKYKEPEPIDTEGLPAISETWTWIPLSELGELNRGKSKHRPRKDPVLFGGDYPFIQTGDIRAANGIITTFSQTYNEFGLKQSRLWDEGTLCITIAANIADTAILGMPACFPDSVVGLLPDSSICDVKFIEYFIRTVKHYLECFAPATAQKNINLEILKVLAVPFTSLEEQKEIVRRIESLLKLADNIQQQYQQAEANLDTLNQSILAKAFRGELVPQDPNDEPASVLLKRIKAERAKQEATGKKAKKKDAKEAKAQQLDLNL